MNDDYEVMNTLIDEFHAESDRGCAVLVMCVLEDFLLDAITKRLPASSKDMLRNIAPPGRLSSTLSNAYLLGLVSTNERHEFEVLIKIRNKFAHAALQKLTFEHHDVGYLCGKLRLCDTFAEYPADTPRKRFVMSAVLIALMLRQSGGGDFGRLALKEDSHFNLS